MTIALRNQLRPVLRALPGRKLQDVAERLAVLARKDGTLRFGAKDVTVQAAVGCSAKTVQRLRRALEPSGLLVTIPGSGRAVTQYRWDLDVVARMTAEGGPEGGQQMVDPLGSSPRWHGRAPRGPAGWWDRRRMDALVQDVQDVRPAWTAAGIVAAAVKALRRGATLAKLRTALLAVARAGDSRYPMRVASDGWWWDSSDARHTEPPAYVRTAAPAPPKGRDTGEPLPRKATHQVLTQELRLDERGGHGVRHRVTKGDQLMPLDFRAMVESMNPRRRAAW